MNATEKLAERRELLNKVYRHEPTPRIMTMSNIYTWRYLDSGRPLSEILYSNELVKKYSKEFIDLYDFDIYADNGFRNCFPITDALGGTRNIINDEIGGINIKDKTFIEGDEYEEYIQDIKAFTWSKMFKRYCKEGITWGELNNAFMEYLQYGALVGEMNSYVADHAGAMNCFSTTNVGPFHGTLFNFMRGIKGVSSDMRRHKEAMLEACDKVYHLSVEPLLDPDTLQTKHDGIAAMGFSLLSQSVTNPKQFEDFLWRYIEPVLNFARDYKKSVFIYIEGYLLPFSQYFQDYPKDMILAAVAEDDILDFRKTLPNWSLMGGMDSLRLGSGTPQECIDYAKYLVDNLGPGFILSQQKMISFKNDANRANLLAVNEFARNYSLI